MKLSFDETLIEAVVGSVLTSRTSKIHPLQIKRFQLERERLYSILDPDERDIGFAQFYHKWFQEWELERKFKSIVSQFPLLLRHLSVLAFRKALRKSDEGGELYVNSNSENHGVVALLPEKVKNEIALVRFLNHELMHLNDMVDVAFGYSLDFFNSNSSQRNLMIKRYRVLWDVTIDGRLARKSLETICSKDQRLSEFQRAFSYLSNEKQIHLFDELWSGTVNHEKLLKQIARQNESVLVGNMAPGSPCPLCEFPTFDWYSTDISESAVKRIQKEFPNWKPDEGICTRCWESYAHISMAYPPTLFR